MTTASRQFEVTIDVTDAVATGERLTTSATITVPEPRGTDAGNIVIVGYPGGGYNRHYYDLHPEGLDGYSQAEHHGAGGIGFIACDHLAVGDSAVPEEPLNYEAIARANAATATGALARYLDEVSGDAQGERPTVVGLGHSQGGFFLTLLQANTPTFDGVGFLGWANIETASPWPHGISPREVAAGAAGNGLAHPLRAAFYRDDVPTTIVERDLTRLAGDYGSRAPWGSIYGPGGPALVANRPRTGVGVVAAEAASIDVPVFIGNGDVDLTADPWREPSAYRGSPHITMTVVEHMAHMHNFAGSRRMMWERIDRWARTVDAMRRSGRGA